MTREEHAAARAMGLTIEAGMTVWAERCGAIVQSVVYRVQDMPDGDSVCSCCLVGEGRAWHPSASHLAPDLRDAATYRAAYEEARERVSALASQYTGLPEDDPDDEAVWARWCAVNSLLDRIDASARRATDEDRARLAELLRETAAQTHAGTGGEA